MKIQNILKKIFFFEKNKDQNLFYKLDIKMTKLGNYIHKNNIEKIDFIKN